MSELLNLISFSLSPSLFVGGMESPPNTERYNFQTHSWSYGPIDIPHGLSYGVSLPYKDSFLLIGGQDSVYAPTNEIFWYNPETQDFDLLDQRLERVREAHTAVLVGPDVVECNST